MAEKAPPTATEVANAKKLIDETMTKSALHPVVKAAAFMVQDLNGKFWPDQMPLENVEMLKAVLNAAEVDGRDHLEHAVADLAMFSAMLNTKPESKRMAMHLYALCEVTIHEKGLNPAKPVATDVSLEAVEAAKQALGKDPKVIPGKVNEKPPEGTLRVDQLPGRKPRM